MELNKTKKWFYLLTSLWLSTLLLLGGWWIYLLGHLGPHAFGQEKFWNMMKWEGSSFFLLLILLSGSLLYLMQMDLFKTRSIGAFFASLTHELRTPLASVRLQAQALDDLIKNDPQNSTQIQTLCHRLVHDVSKLESELEKSLQLSRLQRGQQLPLMEVNLLQLWKKAQQKWGSHLPIKVTQRSEGPWVVLADEMSVLTIFRNLLENTERHNPSTQSITIEFGLSDDRVEFKYADNGPAFSGDSKKLGQLFYKHNSSKGTGIGLYLVRALMEKMSGEAKFITNPSVEFQLFFNKAEE